MSSSINKNINLWLTNAKCLYHHYFHIEMVRGQEKNTQDEIHNQIKVETRWTI